jgi:hypothetical protein
VKGGAGAAAPLAAMAGPMVSPDGSLLADQGMTASRRSGGNRAGDSHQRTVELFGIPRGAESAAVMAEYLAGRLRPACGDKGTGSGRIEVLWREVGA